MDFEFSEEQEALRATVRRFLGEQAPIQPYVREMLDDPRGTSDAVWKGLAELGTTGLLVPAAHGGAGMGMVDMGVVLEELGRAVHPGPFLSSAVGAASALVAVGGGDDLLRELASGSLVGTVALLEGDGRDWRTVNARASSGDRLTGTKTFVPDAVGADVVVVAAQTTGGIGLFAVERSAAGMRIEPVATVDGTRKQATLVLEDTPARRLGSPGADVAAAIDATIDRLLVGLVVDGVGAAQAALDMTVAYAGERTQFGVPIGSFQAVQHLCADMLQALELGRAGAYYALWACDAGDPAERHRAAVIAKAFAADTFPSIGASAIQVFGGVGFTWEHDIHLLYKRLLTLQQAYGDATDTLAELADLVL